MSTTPTPSTARIAYLTGEYPRATDTFVQREVDALRRRGIEVLTFSVRATDASHHVGEEQRREAAATFALLPAAKNPLKLLAAHARCLAASPGSWFAGFAAAWGLRWPGLAGAAYALFYFLEAGVLADQLRRRRVSHLHNHFANSSCSVALTAGRIAGIPFSFTMHGPAIFFEPHRWAVGKKIAAARFVACISHYCRSQAMILCGQAHWPKLHIVRCGIEPERYAAVEHRDAGVRGDGTIRLLFVGRLAAVKGLPVLLEAFAKLPERFHLSLIGDGADRNALEAAAAALPGSASGRVAFEGYKSQDEVAAALAETDVFVLPSFAEGVPVVLMEALASGVPVVATPVAGVGELVGDRVCGRLVPPGDVASLAEALRGLGEDATVRTAYGSDGRQRVASAFHADREAATLAKLLRH
ncbi:glycosyltransferase family 4 protein [Phycisphaera mikurensis]|uniref:Putative glycosyltransferase n=1 Tax=Phycisphaera mikurensis (strain NBRC 102666 / KCTC 22515 / FYK2301M01) TaxID=1142394 RepID=I0IBC6_PHYMF|nr:glycosyltransferase family 4 protein [Phycisphaera mikurensis]MBB6443058.1 glycosyltransferase involved in cell wall biosynthesis [Phycisphaera mikurensis]BAM02564.1 putative glycosyltransferase [Phycisphaera mikurensis NBRC 102666]